MGRRAAISEVRGTERASAGNYPADKLERRARDMNAAPLAAALRQFRTEAEPRSDRQLLGDYAAANDPAAFAALVRRHGPMVLGVCRRLLGHLHDAEDAFQATFLVLARKAASVVPPGAVGNWLYGVACRAARKAREAAARRRAPERLAPPRRPHGHPVA